MTAAKHVRYLRGNPVLPIVYKRGQFRLAAFTDSSLTRDMEDPSAMRRLITAQSTVFKHLATSQGGLHLKFYDGTQLRPCRINSDSTGALTVAGNAMHQRTKHVALRYFFPGNCGDKSLHHRPSGTSWLILRPSTSQSTDSPPSSRSRTSRVDRRSVKLPSIRAIPEGIYFRYDANGGV